MKIITRAVLDIVKGRWIEEESHEYRGPIARCMPDARNLGDCVAFPLLPAAVDASAQTTGSGNWVDCSNFIGDLLIVVNIGANVGGYGSVKVQLQSATANTGAGAANETADARNAGLLTVIANGVTVMAYDSDMLANKFVGVACTYTTITSATMSVELIARKSIN